MTYAAFKRYSTRRMILPGVEPRTSLRRRILLDVTHTSQSPLQTGIQRVVKKLTQELIGRSDFETVPVRLHWSDGAFHLERAVAFESALTGAPAAGEVRIQIRTGDIFLLLDSSWWEIAQLKKLFPVIRRAKGRSICCVYDLIPLTHPQFCVDGLTMAFRRWLRTVISGADCILCISNATAAVLQRYIKANQIDFKKPIHIFHLGSDFLDLLPAVTVTSVAQEPIILMVGSIEPRKGHVVALEAFDALWSEGHKLHLHIIGGHGWRSDELLERLVRHPLAGKFLHLTRSADDAHLKAAYLSADLVLSASWTEGFGLPLVEAAALGRPLIVSDIPPYRELCGENAIFFGVGNSTDLAEKLRAWMLLRRAPSPPPVLSWTESAEQLAEEIRKMAS
jgi:glycosyltransferase involved in cell wall biosynthesis